MLLIGALPQPITSAPLALTVYATLILMVASALASVLLRDTLYSIAGFVGTMVFLGILYVAIAPWEVVAVQLVIVAGVNAALLVALLRDTTGLRASSIGPFSREWTVGAAVSSLLFAVLGGVVGAASWPVKVCCSVSVGFGQTLLDGYVIGIWTLALVLGSAAMGSGMALVRSRRPPADGVESGARTRTVRESRSGPR